MSTTGATTTQLRVLIAEDDRRTAELVRLYLERAGYRTAIAADGREVLRLVREQDPDVVVLDLMLPGMDGWDVCRVLRSEGEVPILILSARDEEEDRILGLELGADDYMVKPFSPREVVARVRAILRRARSDWTPAHRCLGRGAIRLHPRERRVVAHGKPVDLTPSEYRILLALMQTPGKTFSRDELLERLYPHGGQVVPKVVDVHIGKLRQKVEHDPARPERIETVRGFGYRYREGG